MKMFHRRCIRLTLFLLAVAITGAPMLALRTVHAAAPDVLELRVEVSYKGFNDDPDFTIEAEQGQLVEITFVWADAAVPDNVHRIEIKDYGLKSGLIDVDDRETTLSFIADKAGTFTIECTWRCEGHKEALQSAHLKVKSGAGGGGSGVSLTGTTLAVEPSAWRVSRHVTLTTTLLDDNGQPVADVPVSFFVDAEFAGTKGPMEIGIRHTDEAGVAALEYRPAITGEQLVTARFDGRGLHAQSEETLQLDVLDVIPAYVEEAKGLESLRRWAPVGVGAVVVAIWSVFGYVGYQMIRIQRGGD